MLLQRDELETTYKKKKLKEKHIRGKRYNLSTILHVNYFDLQDTFNWQKLNLFQLVCVILCGEVFCTLHAIHVAIIRDGRILNVHKVWSFGE